MLSDFISGSQSSSLPSEKTTRIKSIPAGALKQKLPLRVVSPGGK